MARICSASKILAFIIIGSTFFTVYKLKQRHGSEEFGDPYSELSAQNLTEMVDDQGLGELPGGIDLLPSQEEEGEGVEGETEEQGVAEGDDNSQEEPLDEEGQEAKEEVEGEGADTEEREEGKREVEGNEAAEEDNEDNGGEESEASNLDDFAPEDAGIADVPQEFRPEDDIFWHDLPESEKVSLAKGSGDEKSKKEENPSTNLRKLAPEVVKDIGKEVEAAEAAAEQAEAEQEAKASQTPQQQQQTGTQQSGATLFAKKPDQVEPTKRNPEPNQVPPETQSVSLKKPEVKPNPQAVIKPAVAPPKQEIPQQKAAPQPPSQVKAAQAEKPAAEAPQQQIPKLKVQVSDDIGNIRDDIPPPDKQPSVAEIKQMSDWEKAQSDRRQLIKGYCTAAKIPGDVSYIINRSGATKTWSGNYLVDDKNKVIFCNIPKTASTYLKLVMANHSGDVRFDENQSHARLQMAHRWDFLETGNIKPLNELSPEAILSRVDSYKKFMFTRSPVERFIGAYREKLEEEIRLPGVNEMILQHNRPGYNPALDGQRYSTFEEFTKWFNAYGHTTDNWSHYYLGCIPCFMDYDYIGHVENMETDLYNIVHHIYGREAAEHIKDTAPTIRAATMKRLRDTHDLAKAYLNTLTGDEKSKLFESYSTDAALFGYDFMRDYS